MSKKLDLSSKDLYFRLLGHVKPFWKQFGFGIFAMILLAITEPLIPALLKPLLDGSFVEKDPDYIFWAPILVIILFSTRGLTSFASQAIFSWVAGKVVLDLRQRMFQKILQLPTPFFDVNATGNLISKVTINVMHVTTAATRVLTILVKDTLIIIGLLGYMLYLNWQLSVMVFVFLPILAAVVGILGLRLRKLSRQLQDMIGEMTHVLEESVRGHKVIKVFGGQRQEGKRFDFTANWVRRFNFKVKIADAAGIPLVEGMAAVMIAILIYVGTGDGENSLTVGEFVAFLAALGLLFPPIKRLTGINHPLQKGLAGAESVFAILDEDSELDTGKQTLTKAQGRIEYINVEFQYAMAETPAVKNASFAIEPGETVALVGASGSGKTTIATLLPRFYDPQSGVITLDGVDIKDLARINLRDQIAYVGQESTLFNNTVAANIAYGIPEAEVNQEQLVAAAQAAHALDFIETLPNGFNTTVGEDGVRLSGGQRQRIAIARAIFKDSPILILDEATSSLDTESERKVQAALENLTNGRSTLVIAHRLSTIEHADHILVLHEGEIVERGTHASLLSSGGIYSGLYKTQFE